MTKKNTQKKDPFDDRIAEALRSPEAAKEFLDEEDSILSLVADTFRHRTRWLTIVGWIKQVFAVIIAVIAAVKFFNTDDPKMTLTWATVFLTCMITIGMISAVAVIELQRNALAREIKRLELRVAMLHDD